MFFSFTLSNYKNGLIETLLDRCYKINNTWKSSDNDLENLTKSLHKNQFPTKLINKVTKQYLNLKFEISKKIQNLAKTFCKDIDVKVLLVPFKISDKFSYKDPLPFHL